MPEESKEVKEVAPPGFDPKLEKKLLTQYADQPAKAYATMWSIHNKNLKESYDVCEHDDYDEGVNESSTKKCMSCGEQILGQGKTTTKGDTICNSCDRYYAFGGPGEHELDESDFEPTEECVSDCYKNMKHSTLCPHAIEVNESEMCEMCNEDPCTCDYTDNIEPQMKLLPEPAKQPINAAITATMDTATGKKQVTVTADGEGADELLKMLTMAGLNPQMVQPVAPVEEDLANSPNAKYTSSDVQLNKMSDGPNAPHGQYNKDRARDNSMSIDELAESFRKQFVKESKKRSK